MGVGDGTVIGTTKILDNGSPNNRFNLVLVAEGYQATEMTQFHNHCQDLVNHLFATPPFDSFEPAFNVYRIDVSSTDSGADDPVACGGTGATPATYFDASFCNGGIRRLLGVNGGLVTSVVNAAVPQWHQIIVIVNSTEWGGAGGSLAITSTAPGWENISLHEMGHSAFGLADEYEYWASCATDIGHDNYTGGEPAQPNVTIDTNILTNKWRDLIDPATPMPTKPNPDCSECSHGPSPVPAGTVGTFEGARYYHCGIYRPEIDCMMRSLGPFCAVCSRRIEEVLQPYMPWIGDFIEIPELVQEWRVIDWIIDRWILVAYLIINFRFDDLRRRIKTKPTEELLDLIATHMHAYIYRGVMPPKDIAGAIVNLADEYIANKQITLRAGDYIALQGHLREMKR